MSRSFAFLPGAARHGDNVVDLRHRFNALSRRQVSPNLIRNRVSALCAPYAGANIQMRDQVISVHGSGPFGIDIGLCLHEGRCTLWLGGWHDEMPDVDMALGFVARAIDGRLRLKVLCVHHRPRANGSSSARTTMASGWRGPLRVACGCGGSRPRPRSTCAMHTARSPHRPARSPRRSWASNARAPRAAASRYFTQFFSLKYLAAPAWSGAELPSLTICPCWRLASAGCSFLNSSKLSNTALVS